MCTIRNILYSIKKYRYVHVQWTFRKNIENIITENTVFICAYCLLLTYAV